MIFNQFLNTNGIALRDEPETSPFLDISLGGQLTLFLTIPALKFALESDMPATHYLNLADGLFILATLVVTVNLALTVLSHSWAFVGSAERAVKFERFSKYFAPLVSLMGLGLVIFITSS